MSNRQVLQTGFSVAVLCSWPGAADAFEVMLSGAIERGPNRARIEVLASVSLPLDEWTQTTPALASWVNTRPSFARAWNRADPAMFAPVLPGAPDFVEASLPDPNLVDANFVDPSFLDPSLYDPNLVDPGLVDRGLVEPSVDDQTAPSSRVTVPSPRAAKLSEPGAAESAAPASEAEPEKKTTAGAGSASASRSLKLDREFIRALMSACSGEFRDVRGDLDDLASRARLSAWLPELQVKGGRNTDQTLRLTPTEAEPDRYQVVGGDGVRFEGQLRWTFSQLVFARDELSVARLRGALDSERRKRQQQAMEALGKWYVAWTQLGTQLEPGDILRTWVSESTLRTELDWLTQGWFSSHVPAAPDLAALLTD